MTTRTPIETSAPVPSISAPVAENPSAKENLGQRLTREAADLGVPVSVIARAAGIDRITIYRWKKGACGPYQSTWARVEDVLKDFWSRVGGGRSA